MRQSKIFGNKELELLENRIKGIKTDKTGLFSRKAKPKLEELINVWLPRKKELIKVLKGVKKCNLDLKV